MTPEIWIDCLGRVSTVYFRGELPPGLTLEILKRGYNLLSENECDSETGFPIEWGSGIEPGSGSIWGIPLGNGYGGGTYSGCGWYSVPGTGEGDGQWEVGEISSSYIPIAGKSYHVSKTFTFFGTKEKV